MPKKLTLTKKWMLDHPDDTPCPREGTAAMAWRRARGIRALPFNHQQYEQRERDGKRYAEAMAEKRLHEWLAQGGSLQSVEAWECSYCCHRPHPRLGPRCSVCGCVLVPSAVNALGRGG